MERKLQEFAQGFQVPRIIAVRHNPPLWGPGGWELETKGLNPDVGNILVTWTPSNQSDQPSLRSETINERKGLVCLVGSPLPLLLAQLAH